MEWLDEVYFENSIQDYLVFVGLIVAALIVARLIGGILRRYVIRRAGKTESRLDDLVKGVGVRPVTLIVFLTGLHAAVKTLRLPEWLDHIVWPVFVVAWTVVGAVFVVRLINGLLIHYIQRFAEKTEDALFAQLVGMIRSAVGLVVWIIAGLFLVANLGFDVSSLLAGLGLGGLALAMASKDTLANVFGSFTILVNGPFHVGDAVHYQGHEGSVEEIGLRDTRIRLYNGNLVIVPNAMAPTSVVENISRRPSFRVLFKLGLTYETPTAKIELARELIREAVRAEAGTAEKVLIHLVEFGESSLDLQVLYYIEDTGRLLDIRDAINRRIKESLEREGIEIAYRTLTVKQA